MRDEETVQVYNMDRHLIIVTNPADSVLLIGIVVGTYSSIFIASPLVHRMDQYLANRESTKLREARGGVSNAAKA